MYMLQEILITFRLLNNFFKNSFLPSTIIEWNNLDPILRNSKRFGDFKDRILKHIRPCPSSVFNCDNCKGIALITRLRVGLSHLCQHKFKYSFQNCLNTICSCGLDIESTSHFLLHCPRFNDERYIPLSTLNKTNFKLLELANSPLSQTPLHGNTLILNTTIKHILSTERFEEALN